MSHGPKSVLGEAQRLWPELNGFKRFEYLVSLVIMVLISIIVTIALFRLGKNVYFNLVTNALDPLEFKTFQLIFGNILTLLIAIEFRHSIESVMNQEPVWIQVRSILLISIMAVARKFIVLDKAADPTLLAALALVCIALAITYIVLKKDSMIGGDAGGSG